MTLANSIAAAAAAVQQPALVPVPIYNGSEDARWRQWKQQSLAADARFRRNLRTVLVDGAGIVALAGALWFAFATWL